MRFVKVGGALLLVTDLALHGGGFHLDVASYHGEPLPSSQFDEVSTATVNPIWRSGDWLGADIPKGPRFRVVLKDVPLAGQGRQKP